MLIDIFKSVLYMSLTGSVIAAVIIMVKKITGKIFSARWHYFLWFLLLIKLLVPFNFSSSLSLFNIYKTPTDFSYYGTNNISTRQIEKITNKEITNQPVQSGKENKPLQNTEKSTPAAQKSAGLLDICAYLWALGVIVLATAAIVSYRRMYSQTTRVPVPYREYIVDLLQNCTNDSEIGEKISIRFSKHFISPFTFGILEPCIVIPETLIMDKQKLDIILRHELVHIKRHDHTIRVLSYLLQAIHWFNPLIWISFKLMAKDCEVSCDSVVIKTFDEDMKNKYAMLLIETAQMISVPQKFLKVTAFSESNLKKRINSITRFEKQSILSVVLSVLIFALLSAVLVTSANANDNILNENFNKIQTIKISSKSNSESLRINNERIQSYDSLGLDYFTLSIYTSNNILLFNINNFKEGTYIEKTLDIKNNKKECRIFYDTITKKSKEISLVNNRYFVNKIYDLEITYKNGKVDYLSTDSKDGYVYKTLKNGRFLAANNTELLNVINEYSTGLLSDLSDKNPTATTYYGKPDAESLGIKRPEKGDIIPIDKSNGSPIYGKAKIIEADKTAVIEIETSQLSKIKKGNSVYIAGLDGTIKSTPDAGTIKNNKCSIEADIRVYSNMRLKNLELDAYINCFTLVPTACINVGSNGKKYVWVSDKSPEEIKSADNTWRLVEVEQGESHGLVTEVTTLQGMQYYKSIYQFF